MYADHGSWSFLLILVLVWVGETAMQKQHRLRSKEDFTSVYRYGKSVANHQFVLYYKPKPGQEYYRLGISVSKKVGGAVVRNRMRRVIKEIVRANGDRIKQDYDLILIVRRAAIDLDYTALEKSIRHILKRASLLKLRSRNV